MTRDVFPNRTDRTFLNACPPLEWERASGPMRVAITRAMLDEDPSENPDDAASKTASGEIRDARSNLSR